MIAKTPAQRKATERARKRAAGLTEVRGIWAPAEQHAAIKTGRRLCISRAEAEFLTDILMQHDVYLARDLSEQIRETFGMCSEEEERELIAKRKAGPTVTT